MQTPIVRQVAMDTETTGINQIGIPHYEGHNIIEIGAVEIVNRRLTGNNFHVYIKPDRFVDLEAFRVHGIADEFLIDKPTFADIVSEFFDYVRGAELIVHNASFDIGFIDYESDKLHQNIPKINTFCKIIDSLKLARDMFPGKRNSLDALCSRYEIDNNERILHSALIDAKILANVYLAMTREQISILFRMEDEYRKQNNIKDNMQRMVRKVSKLRVILANNEELAKHESYFNLLKKNKIFS